MMEGEERERGYTLFLTVLVIVVFSVITMTLMTVTITGAKRSEVRETVTQAEELAEKGVIHLMNQINHELQRKVEQVPESMKQSDFINELEKIIANYTCVQEENWIHQINETGKYKVCVHEDLDRGSSQLPHKVKIKSEGRAEDRSKTLYATVEFNGNAFPDNKKFAMNTFITEECKQDRTQCVPGEGNLFLHGGVGVKGDINVERNLITSNRSRDKYGLFEYWIHSYFPSALPLDHQRKAKILLGKDVYTVTWPASKKGVNEFKFDYPAHIARIDNFPNEAPYTKKAQIDEEVFRGAYVPVKSKRKDHPGYNKLDISKEIEEKRSVYEYRPNEAKLIDANIWKEGGLVIGEIRNSGEKYKDTKGFLYRKKLIGDPQYDRRFYLTLNNTFKQLATDGDLQIGRLDRAKPTNVRFKEGLYVKGDLVIRKNSTVTGPIYVGGDLIINGSNVQLNGPVYVNGKINIKASGNMTFNNVFYTNKTFRIQHAKMPNEETADKGKDFEEDYNDESVNNIDGDFIVYAMDAITIKRVNRFNSQPNVIRAYLYSNTSVELDGNESNIHIKGGVSAPRIVANSIQGNSSMLAWRTDGPGRQATWGSLLRYYDGTAAQVNRPSRLQIHYDDAIFKKYSHLLLEQRITQTVPPKIVNLK